VAEKALGEAMSEQQEGVRLPELYTDNKEVVRSPSGTFLPGKSGNPAGRPKGKKNRITELKQDMELALREGLNPEVLKAVLASMVTEALEGNVTAAKLILDKVMENAKSSEESGEESPEIIITINNLTKEDLIEATGGRVLEHEEITDGKSIEPEPDAGH
jgi:hypothetical protein